MFSHDVLKFYKSLKLDNQLPHGVTAMNPYRSDETFTYCEQFYSRFYADDNKRKVILGINPGRLGGGITGVPFTDPIKLDHLGIKNTLIKKPELSADFIYLMIEAYGGVESFYRDCFITAMSPLGFIKDDKNINYYDIPELQNAIEPFIIQCIRQQLTFNIHRNVFCLGEGQNFKYLSKLNKKYSFFEHIEPLPHPRFIMQYRRRQLDRYVSLYIEKLK
jgi:hypothetical protein